MTNFFNFEFINNLTFSAASQLNKISDNIASGLGLSTNHGVVFSGSNVVKLLLIALIIIVCLFILTRLWTFIFKRRGNSFAMPAFLCMLFLIVTVFFRVNSSMFYTVSQLTIFISSAFYLIFSALKNRHLFTTGFILLAVFFNPFFRISISSGGWRIVDIAAMIFYAVYFILVVRK